MKTDKSIQFIQSKSDTKHIQSYMTKNTTQKIQHKKYNKRGKKTESKKCKRGITAIKLPDTCARACTRLELESPFVKGALLKLTG